MKSWNLQVPVVMSLFLQVEGGETEEEAVGAALASAALRVSASFHPEDDTDLAEGAPRVVSVEMDSWEMLEQVTRGNVFYGPINEISVELDFDDDEEGEEG